jgi:hypothetical protein
MPTASTMCRIKNRSYFLARKMYTDVAIIRDIVMIV